MTHEEIIREYHNALTDWEIDQAKALLDCSTRDERSQASTRFLVEHEDTYRHLMDLRSQVLLFDEQLNIRHTVAHEAAAEEHRRANEILETTTGMTERAGEVVNKE